MKDKKGIVIINIVNFIALILLTIIICIYIIFPYIGEKFSNKNVLEFEKDNLNTENSSDVEVEASDETENDHIHVDMKNGNGQITVSIVDSANRPVKNTIMYLYDSEGYYLAQFGVDEEGMAGVKGLGNGTYYFKQHITRDGYSIDDTFYRIRVDDENRTFKKTIKIEQLEKSSLIIALTDENKNPIENATFEINYTSNDREPSSRTVTTNKNGLAGLKNIVEGLHMTVKQISAPEGYEIDNNEYELYTTVDGETKRFDIVNKSKEE